MVRRAGWMCLLALMGLVLAACGGGGGGSTDANGSPDEDAAGVSVAMSKENFGDRVRDATMKAGSAHVTVTTSLGNHDMAMESDIVWSEDGATASHTVTSMGMDVEVIQIDDVAYLKMGAMTGGKFIKVDPNDPDSPLSDLNTSPSGDSGGAHQLRVFDESVVEVELLGDGGEMDGVKTTEYEVTVDLKSAMASLNVEIPEDEADEVPDVMVYTVFIGDDDLIRRMTTDMMGTTMTMDFSAWGQKVDVTAPPADQITDSLDIPGFDPEMLEGLSG